MNLNTLYIFLILLGTSNLCGQTSEIQAVMDDPNNKLKRQNSLEMSNFIITYNSVLDKNIISKTGRRAAINYNYCPDYLQSIPEDLTLEQEYIKLYCISLTTMRALKKDHPILQKLSKNQRLEITYSKKGFTAEQIAAMEE